MFTIHWLSRPAVAFALLFTTRARQRLLAIAALVIGFASATAQAAPQLVTPQLPPGIQGQAYAASLLIGSALALTSAGVTGLPAGLTATHNGGGSIAISGTPTVSGSFTLGVTATDNAAGSLSASVSLSIIQVANNATSISSVGAHTCAILNGGVQCWGFNGSGQLGNNSTTSSTVPIQAIAAGSNVTAVSAGLNHTCAVVNGGVQCWG